MLSIHRFACSTLIMYIQCTAKDKHLAQYYHAHQKEKTSWQKYCQRLIKDITPNWTEQNPFDTILIPYAKLILLGRWMYIFEFIQIIFLNKLQHIRNITVLFLCWYYGEIVLCIYCSTIPINLTKFNPIMNMIISPLKQVYFLNLSYWMNFALFYTMFLY